MPYYKFDRNDIFVNTLKLYPEVKFVIYSGSSYYNNTPAIPGAFADPIKLTAPRNISLFEMNIDRASTSTGRFIGPETPSEGVGGVEDNGLIYPWLAKDGSRLNFRTNTQASFISSNPGDIITGAPYPYTASISKEHYSTTTPRYTPAVMVPNEEGAGPDIQSYGSVSHLLALQNTINYYRYLSPHFEFSSSADSVSAGIHNRNMSGSSELPGCEVGLVSIPSIFYGNQIKKGSVKLDFYITGSLIATAEDTRRNGELIQTYGIASLTDTVVGLVLYNEGFIILTSSLSLRDAAWDNYLGSTGVGPYDNPRWTYFAQSISGSEHCSSSAFVMQMSGTTNTQVMTMFATAPKGELNHSNNPSYIQSSSLSYVSTASAAYLESETIAIKNVVSSAYADPTGSFEKTTYISKIGVYDKNRNLIGLAKVATPVKKTIGRDFTFKIKLDI